MGFKKIPPSLFSVSEILYKTQMLCSFFYSREEEGGRREYLRKQEKLFSPSRHTQHLNLLAIGYFCSK